MSDALDDDFRVMVKSDGKVALYWLSDRFDAWQASPDVVLRLAERLIRAAAASTAGMRADEAAAFMSAPLVLTTHVTT